MLACARDERCQERARFFVGIAACAATLYWFAQYGIETFVSDAATRLAYQIRDEAAALKRSGQTRHTFVHAPKSWPDGVAGDYRIEIKETVTSPRPGHRSTVAESRSL